MKKRDIATCIILSIITCGIYGLIWFVNITDDTNQAISECDVTGGTALLFSIITCGIYAIYWSYKMGEKINRAKAMRNMPTDSTLSILYLVLTIFGLQIVTQSLIQNELNKM